MGSSESKIAVVAAAASTPRPESKQCPRNNRVNQLIDPRSPSTDIDRTPIQVAGVFSRPSVESAAMPSGDPRSPTVGITRTPVKVTVRSFARRLGMLFLSETTEVAPSDLKVEEELADGELDSTEPLLTPRPPQREIAAAHSPFVDLEEVEVETEAEADFSLEEAEEAREFPLHKRLSMSLITCHEGAAPVQIFAEVHQDCPPSPAVAEPHGVSGPDHAYALPSVSADPASPSVTPSQPPTPTVTEVVAESPELPEEKTEEVPATEETPEVQGEKTEEVPATEETPEAQEEKTEDSPVTIAAAEPSPGPTQEQQTSTGIRCPTMDTKSPSQLVFKPQWLGKGFGATRAQGRGGKGGFSSSPLSLRPGAKNAADENKGQQTAKQKQRGKPLAEGRSPLQILKETNSPRDQSAQMKLKVSTPDRQRLGQLDRRVLAMSLNKENR